MVTLDLREAFPDMNEFSRRSLGYMKAFAAAWPDRAILQGAFAKLSWSHNMLVPQIQIVAGAKRFTSYHLDGIFPIEKAIKKKHCAFCLPPAMPLVPIGRRRRNRVIGFIRSLRKKRAFFALVNSDLSSEAPIFANLGRSRTGHLVVLPSASPRERNARLGCSKINLGKKTMHSKSIVISCQ
jgi:hypothetical protein